MVEIRLVSDSCSAVVSCDGQTVCNIGLEDKCIIKKSEVFAEFIRFDKINFFNLLRSKMNNSLGERI